jgi:hypothetical protein
MCKIVKMRCTKHGDIVATDNEFCSASTNRRYCAASIMGKSNNQPKRVKRDTVYDDCREVERLETRNGSQSDIGSRSSAGLGSSRRGQRWYTPLNKNSRV